MVNVDATIVLMNIATDSITTARRQRDVQLLRHQNGEFLTIDEIRLYAKATPEDFDAAISVLGLELELSKSGDDNCDDPPA